MIHPVYACMPPLKTVACYIQMQQLRRPHDPADSHAQLRAKLEQVGDSFNISRLTDSGMEAHNPSGLFPHRNEPTLDLKETEEQEVPRFMESDLGQYPEGLTARYTNEPSTLQHLEALENRVEQLGSELALKEREADQHRRELEVARGEISRLNQEKKQQAEHIRKLSREVEGLRSRSREESKNSSRGSSFSDSCANFYPELLSPGETVELLGQLLRKVGASQSMARSLSGDAALKDIIGRLSRH